MNPPFNDIVLNNVAFSTDESNADIKMEALDGIDNFDESGARKPWMKRAGAPVVKIAPEVKRRRKNYQAKKLLIPKNPLMILNELKPGLPFNVAEKLNESNQTIFVASVEVDGESFTGEGLNKKHAQQQAAEAALRGLFFYKLMEQLEKKEDEDVPMKDADSQSDGALKSQVPEDDTPWSGLASLAMFKLASMWQNPDTPSAPVPIQAAAASPCLKGKLPPNASEVDPVMLLNQISPQSKFTEHARDVRNGATVFTLTVDFNGQAFTGSATKKKAAKKICAKSALKTLGVEYND